MYSRPLAPPPGLGVFDETLPVKVELPFRPDPRYVNEAPSLEAATNPFTKDRTDSAGYASQVQAYEWACKMSYLNAQVGQSPMAHSPMAHFNNPYAMMQAQLQAQQRQSLLANLLQLPREDMFLPPPAVAIAGGPRPGKGPADSPQEAQRLPHKATDRSPKTPPSASRKVQTLSTSLQLLSGEDPDCLFIVRRINKLGFKAVRTLKRHFSTYGPVMKVLLAHSTVRQHGDPASHARRRPSSLGFIQMISADATNKVLALGAEQEVDGVLIRVQRFERQRMTEGMEGESDNEDLYSLGAETPTCKIKRGMSEDSMSTVASPLHTSMSTPSEVTKSPSLSSSAQVPEMDSDHDLNAFAAWQQN